MARDWKERCPRVKCDCDECENGLSYLLVFFTWDRLSRCSSGCLWSHDILPWPPKCWDQRQDIHTCLILILPNSLPVGVCFLIHFLKLSHYNFKSSSLPHFFLPPFLLFPPSIPSMTSSFFSSCTVSLCRSIWPWTLDLCDILLRQGPKYQDLVLVLKLT